MSIAPAITSRWPSHRARFLFQEINEKGHELPLASVTRSGGVEFRADLDISVWSPGEDVSSYKRVMPGDFVIGLRSFQSGLGYSSLEGLVSPAYSVLRPRREDMYFGYYRHLLKADVTVSLLENISQGIRQGRTIAVDDFNELLLPLPPIGTQRAIADYLDREIARIDALIAAKQRMAKLLDERCAAFIFSRLRCISSTTAALGQTSRIYSGTGFPHEYQGINSGELPFYKVADLASSENRRTICRALNWIDLNSARELGCRLAPPTSILFPKVGAALLANQRRITTVSAAFDNNLMAVTPKEHDSRFLRYFLSLVDLGELANPGPVPSINEDVVGALRVPVPSLAAQRETADELDKIMDVTIKTTNKLREHTELLSERREALVTAAITGQLNIPEAA